MKKLLFAIGIGFMSGSLYAACHGPYCYDDKGAYINAAPTVYSATSAQLSAISPVTAGQIIYCSNCTETPLCISTGTTLNAWAAVSVSTGSNSSFGFCR